MANIDEIKKKKMLEQISAEEVEAVDSSIPQEEPVGRFLSSRNNNLSHLAPYADAINPIVALLGGASPSVVNAHFDRANSAALTKGKEAEITKDKIAVIENDEGDPENIHVRDSIGKKPYYQSKLGSLKRDSSGDIFATKNIFDRETNSFKTYGITRDGRVMDMGIEPSLGVGSTTHTDVYGTKETIQYSKNDPSVKNKVKKTPGYGTLTGVPIETQKKVDRLADKYAKDTDILETKRNDISSAISIFKNKAATPTELTAAREAIIRAITTETRLTDQDVARALGNDFRSILDQAFSFINARGFGEMDDTQKGDFLKAASTLQQRLENALNFAYNKTKQRTGALPGGKGAFESQTPDRTKIEADSAKSYREKVAEAERRYGKDTPMYNKFIQHLNIKSGK